MKVDFYKEHKALLATMKKMGISILTAEEFKSFVKRGANTDAKTFENIKFENGAHPILIERNGNTITVYDSDGKYKYFKGISPDIVREMNELVSTFKPTLVKYEYSVTFNKGFPLRVVVEAVDIDDATEKLNEKLKMFTSETPKSITKIN